MAWSSGLQLRVIDGQRERKDRVIRLDGKELQLGRAAQGQRPSPGQLLFKEPTVSRVHATLTWKPLKGGFQLVHKSGTNPTLVNGKPTKKILLAPGDRVQMGLLILELEDAPGGRTSSSSRASRSSMTEPIMEALSKVEREHEEDRRRTQAEREEKQRQREIMASPDNAASPTASSRRSSSRLDEALRSAPSFSPEEESRKRRRSSGSFGWQPPEEREDDYGWAESAEKKPVQAPPPEREVARSDSGWGSSRLESAQSEAQTGWGDESNEATWGGGSSEADFGWGTPSPPKRRRNQQGWDEPPSSEPPAETPKPRTIPITSLEEKKPLPVKVEHEISAEEAVYELVVVKGPDKGANFPLKDMVMVLGQQQGDEDERIGQGVLLNDATLPGEIGMFAWQGREGAYGLLASENSMQIIEVERIERGQKRRIRVDSHSSLLLKIADEIQVGLTTLRVQKIGEPLPELELQRPKPQADSNPEPLSSPPPAQRQPAPTASFPDSTPGRPTPLRSRDTTGFGAPPPPPRPQPPPSRPSRPEPPRQTERPAPPPRPTPEPARPAPTSPPPPQEEEGEVPLWAQGTIVPGSEQNRSTSPPPAPRASGANRNKPSDQEVLEWGTRPKVDFLLEFIAGPMRGCQISLSRADLERCNRINAGAQGPRANEVTLEGPDVTNEAFHLIIEGGRFSLCNESISGLLVINRSPMKTGDRVVLMTGDVITIGATKIRFLERDIVNMLSQFGLEAESGVTADQDRIFPLNRQRLLIGRGKACDVRLSDLEVSRVHLGLAFSDGRFSVQHRSETNPTFLNGLSLLPGTVRKIKEGDRIRLSSLTVLKLIRR